jgi:hypothetical protein
LLNLFFFINKRIPTTSSINEKHCFCSLEDRFILHNKDQTTIFLAFLWSVLVRCINASQPASQYKINMCIEEYWCWFWLAPFSGVQWSAEYWPLQVKFNSQSGSPLAGFSSLFLSLPSLHVINGPLLLCS